MPGETGPEASSQTSKVGAQVARERRAEMVRLAREAAQNARGKASEAAITSARVGIAKRDLGENREPVPICSSEAIAKNSSDERKPVRSPEPIATQLAPMQKTVASEASSPVHPSSWFVEQPSSEPVTSVPAKKKKIEERIADWIIAVGTALRGRAETPKRVADESRSPAPLPSLERITKAPAEIQKTVAPESTSAVQSPAPLVERARPRVIAVYRASDYMPVLDLETTVRESAGRVPVSPLGRRLASWWIAIGSALRGPWRDAVLDFYERMTELSWWWRAVIKPVLKFLARFIPGREPEPSRLSKAIREGFRFLHEPPTPWPPQWQPKKPQDPPKPR